MDIILRRQATCFRLAVVHILTNVLFPVSDMNICQIPGINLYVKVSAALNDKVVTVDVVYFANEKLHFF